LDEILIVR